MNICYFLGANTRAGFVSLYDSFCSGPSDYMYIIKGGPGGGKSSFMRRIGEAAGERGFDVEYVLCSGDADSLDGVYLPALRIGFVDGTYPHVIEPRNTGADSCYVNLGCFCSCDMTAGDARRITELTAEYKSHYSRAYLWLAAAGSVSDAPLPGAFSRETLESVKKRAVSAVRHEVGGARQNCTGAISKRFLSSVSGAGDYNLYGELNKQYRHIYALDDRLSLARHYLSAAAEAAVSSGRDIIVCPSPLSPDTPEAVLIPEAGAAFTVKPVPSPHRHVRLDAMGDAGAVRPALRRKEALRAALMSEAGSALSDAKSAHDALEAVYRPYMDFDGLTAYTKETIEALFG